jgi:hypothetical protein
MAWEKGQKTRGSILWMTHGDVARFSEALHASLQELRWSCHHVGKECLTRHDHATLCEALHCRLGEQNVYLSQAHTMLPFGTATSLGLLLFNFSARYPKSIVPETDFGPSTDKSVYPKEFRSVQDSSLSIRWNVNDGNEEQGVAIDAQVKQIWKVLNSVTRPVKCHGLVDGMEYSTRRYRIGPDMLETVQREGWVIQQGLFYVLD